MPSGAGGPAPIAALLGPEGLPQAPGSRRRPRARGVSRVRGAREGNGPYPRHVTRDERSHSGGAWKGARAVEDILGRSTRAGTYDERLRRIGQ